MTSEQFLALCDFFERMDYPEQIEEDDRTFHTSKESRTKAMKLATYLEWRNLNLI